MFKARDYDTPSGLLLQMYHKFAENVRGKKRKLFKVTLAIFESAETITGTIGTSDPIFEPFKASLKLLPGQLSLRPEGILYLFEVDRTAKNLFLFCASCIMDQKSLEFSWSVKERTDFLEFCELFGAPPSMSTVEDSMKLLVEHNLVCSIKYKKYMCNPMVIHTPDALTQNLLNTYIGVLAKKEHRTGKLGGLVQEKLFPKPFL